MERLQSLQETDMFFVRMKQTAKVKSLFDKIDATGAENSCYETERVLSQGACWGEEEGSRQKNKNKKAEELRLQSQKQKQKLRELQRGQLSAFTLINAKFSCLPICCFGHHFLLILYCNIVSYSIPPVCSTDRTYISHFLAYGTLTFHFSQSWILKHLSYSHKRPKRSQKRWRNNRLWDSKQRRGKKKRKKDEYTVISLGMASIPSVFGQKHLEITLQNFSFNMLLNRLVYVYACAYNCIQCT